MTQQRSLMMKIIDDDERQRFHKWSKKQKTNKQNKEKKTKEHNSSSLND